MKRIDETHNSGYYLFKFLNSNNIVFDNVEFDESMNTSIALFDVSEVSIKNCYFRNIGGDTDGKKYSYDGIFIGAYSNGTSKVKISNCLFENIGTNKRNAQYKNDGDGIQLYSRNSGIEEILIEGNDFRGIGRRGVKIQTGNSISIKNNRFTRCMVALGIPMFAPTNNIEFSFNSVEDGIFGISPNAPKNKPYGISNFRVRNNEFLNIRSGIRTSGSSHIRSGIIEKNVFRNIEEYVLDGQISNTEIANNDIVNFQFGHNKRVGSAIYLWNNSENTIIKSNQFSTNTKSTYDIYLYPESKNIIVDENTFQLNGIDRERKIVNKSTSNKINH